MPRDLPADETAAPPNPPISPMTTCIPSGALRRRTRSIKAIQIGTSAMISATMPVSTPRCSATATEPFPPRSSRQPTTAAERHCRAVGRRQPRRIRLQPMRIAPARQNRTAGPTSGGIVWLDRSIARYVVPQKKYTTPSPVQIRAALGELGSDIRPGYGWEAVR